MKATVGQLLVNDALPEDMRDYQMVLDKKGVRNLMADLARKHPEDYREVSHKLSQIGWRSAQESGGYSFGLEHMLKSKTGRETRQRIQKKINEILADDRLTDEQREQLILKHIGKEREAMQSGIFDEARAAKNPLAMQVLGSGRGNPMNLSSLLGSDLLYTDQRDRLIPIPVLRSYSEGLSPAEYWAGTYGARKGVMCLAKGTQVLMADYTDKPIEKVKPGDWVMGSDRQGRMTPVRVIRRYYNGVQPCYRYRFRKNSCRLPSSHRTLVATEKHKVLATVKAGRPGSTYAHRSIYVPTPLPLEAARLLKNPVKNEYVATPAAGEAGEQSRVREPSALLYGLMLGDGCMAESTRGRYLLSCNDPLLLDDLREYISLFDVFLDKAGGDNYNYTLAGDGGAAVAVDLKTRLGEKLAHDKELPEGCFAWDDVSVGQLLGGLFSTDGSITGRNGNATIKLTLSSRRMVEQVQRLLELRLGIWSGGLIFTAKEKKKNATHDQWGFAVSHAASVARFFARVPLYGKKRVQAKRIAATMKPDHSNGSPGFKIYDREPAGEIATYDLEVDHPDHLFVLSSGLVVSNSTKFATQEAGFLSKQLNQMGHRLVVTDEDGDGEPDSLRGLPVDVDDPDSAGSLLAHDAGGYKRNTVITPKILHNLRRQGLKRILVRSPTVGGSPEGGIYSRDAGVREKGGLPGRGENIGLAAAQALCLSGGTRVQMANGEVKAVEDVKPGDVVLGCSVDGVLRPVPVLDACFSGIKSCVKALFRRGTGKAAKDNLLELVATPEHKILSEIVVRSGRGSVKRVPYFDPVAVRPLGTKIPHEKRSGGDRFCAKLASSFDDTGLGVQPLAFLLGLVIGDGCYSGSANCVGFSCYDPVLAADVGAYLKPLNFEIKNNTDNEYRVVDTTHRQVKRREDGSWYRSRLIELLRVEGMFGQTSSIKTLPKSVHSWDNASVAALIAGLLVTDGYVISTGGLGFGSNSKCLLDGVRQLLGLRWGVWGSSVISSTKKRADGDEYAPNWRFTVNRRDDVNLLRSILPVAGVKRGRLDSLLSKWNSKRRSARGAPRVKGRCTRISLERVGELPTYDLYIAHPDHLFVLANGLVVSNSEPLSQAQLCLAAGTLVRMADWTVKRIEQVRADEQIMGADKSGRLFPVRVVRVYDNGERECVRTVFREAKTKQHVDLVSTGDHKLLSKTRHWAIPSERVEHGVFPVARKCVGYSAKMPFAVVNDHGCAEPFAGLCGLLLGDGGYTVSVHGVHWSCFEPDLVEEMQPYLAGLGLKATKLQGHEGHEGYYRISQVEDAIRQDPETGRVLPGDRNPALIWLKQHRMYGKYAHEKEIPEEIWSWDQNSVARLLGCLFATDGSVYPPTQRPDELYINFSSTSLELAKQVKELIQVRFAIHSSSIGSHKGKRKRKLYSFTITRKEQVRRFASRIAVPARKGQMLADYLPKLQEDESTEYFHRQRQEPVGTVATYDLEVDHPDHLFVLANGLIVSNSAKHSGGVAGSEKAVSGFDYINQLIQVPKKFKGGAAHAQVDGIVSRIEEAPAGGKYVVINNEKHYVGPDFSLKVKRGDEIEAGDVLSEGIPNPSEVVRHKGVGEGRRYFTQAFRQAMHEAGIHASRRNVELLGRGLIDHVRMTDEYDQYVPDDVVPYSALEHRWQPREGSRRVPYKQAVGKYLERPVLHYTIGTKIRKSMLKDFEDFGVEELETHDEPPPFEPEMIRGMYSVQHDPDWMTRMYGSGQKKSLLSAVHRGGTSDELGTSFVPGLARGVDFGRQGLVTPPAPPQKMGSDMQKEAEGMWGTGAIPGSPNFNLQQQARQSYNVGNSMLSSMRGGGGVGPATAGDANRFRQYLSSFAAAPGPTGAPAGQAAASVARPAAATAGSAATGNGLTTADWHAWSAGPMGAGAATKAGTRPLAAAALRYAPAVAKAPGIRNLVGAMARPSAAAQALSGVKPQMPGTVSKWLRPGYHQYATKVLGQSHNLAQGAGKFGRFAGKAGRLAGPLGLAVAPLEFGIRGGSELYDMATGQDTFGNMVDQRLRDAGNWQGPTGYAGAVLNTPFSPSSVAALGKAKYDLAMAPIQSFAQRRQSLAAGNRLNEQLAENREAAGGVDELLQHAPKDIASRYARKYVDDTPWYGLGGFNPFVNDQGRMTWVDKGTGEEAGSGAMQAIEQVKQQNQDREAAQEAARYARQKPQQAAVVQAKPAAPAPAQEARAASLLGNPIYRQVLSQVSAQSPEMGAMLLLSGADPSHLMGR